MVSPFQVISQRPNEALLITGANRFRCCSCGLRSFDFTSLNRVFFLEHEGSEQGDDEDDNPHDNVSMLVADNIVHLPGNRGEDEDGDLLSKVGRQCVNRRVQPNVEGTGNVLHDGR